MKRNKKEMIFWILIILPFVVTACFMSLLPEQIPSELLDLEAEWKSKYSFFWKNSIIAVMEIIYYLGFIWRAGKKSEQSVEEREQAVFKNAESNNKKMMLVLFGVLTILNFVSLFLTYQAIKGTELNLANIMSVVVGVILSVCFIVLGNIMPRMHEYTDPFSRKLKNANPRTIRKMNQGSGLGLVVCGILCFIITILLHNVYSMIATFVLPVITAVIITVLSYVIYYREEKNGKS